MTVTAEWRYGEDMSTGVAIDAPEGLRERKKRERRAAIARAALDLFDRQGFRATTVAQVAEAADVSPRTVFAYFPTKEDLLFPDAADTLEHLGARLGGRPAGELTSDALRAWVAEFVDREERDEDRIRRRIIEAEVDLRAHERLVLDAIGDLLTVSLARDLDVGPDDVAAQLAAAAAVGALAAIGRRRRDDDRPHSEECRREALDLFDQAMAFVDGGVRALRARSGRD